MGEDDANELAGSWAMGNSKAVKQVDKLVASGALSMDAVMARTLSANLDHVERIDRMTMNMEGRRHAALREIDRHREALGQQLRRAVQYAEDADFKVVAPKSIAHGGNVA
jgi:polyhydroxyalkanoate synthesis regulator phasin